MFGFYSANNQNMHSKQTDANAKVRVKEMVYSTKFSNNIIKSICSINRLISIN